MNQLNPYAVIFWIFCTGTGYLIGDGRGAVWGLVVGLGMSLLNAVVAGVRDK